MASKEIHEGFDRSRRLIPEQVEVCEGVGKAIEEVKEPLVTQSSAWSTAEPTDFQRAQKQVQETTERCIHLVTIMRESTPNGELIRMHAYLKKVYNCCAECTAINMGRMHHREPFVCLVRERLDKPQPVQFRFSLNEKGDIHEQS